MQSRIRPLFARALLPLTVAACTGDENHAARAKPRSTVTARPSHGAGTAIVTLSGIGGPARRLPAPLAWHRVLEGVHSHVHGIGRRLGPGRLALASGRLHGHRSKSSIPRRTVGLSGRTHRKSGPWSSDHRRRVLPDGLVEPRIARSSIERQLWSELSKTSGLEGRVTDRPCPSRRVLRSASRRCSIPWRGVAVRGLPLRREP